MSAPFGNQNAKGNKGGGRKSAYQEQVEALTLYEMFFGNQNIAKLEAKIRSGEYSVMERHLLKALQGDIHAQTIIFKKIFPENRRSI